MNDSDLHLPSVEALTASDDDLLTYELKVSELHEQLATARRLIDGLDHRCLVSALEHVSDPKLADEVARLGRALVALGESMTKSAPAERHILFTASACGE